MISNPEPKEMIKAFKKSKDKYDENKKQKDLFEYANEDIPFETPNIKKFYDKIIQILKKYPLFKENKQAFFKVRSFIKNGLSKE